MGQVVAAIDLSTGQRVALKFPHPERVHRCKDIARLRREASLIAELASPHVARLHDFVDAEVPFLVLEYVDGLDLATWLSAKHALSAATAAAIVVQACDALGEAHARGLVHRDVKPANVMLTASAENTLVAKVLDFGIARAPEDPERDRLTTTGDLLGSPSYMAPEQMRSGTVDARADVWALGVVLFEAVTGRLPFESSSLPDLCLKILLDEPPPLPSTTPAAYADVVRRCLEKDPTSRYASAREVADALRDVAAPSVPLTMTDIELATMEAAARRASSSIDVAANHVAARPPRRWRWARDAIACLALAFVVSLPPAPSADVMPPKLVVPATEAAHEVPSRIVSRDETPSRTPRARVTARPPREKEVVAPTSLTSPDPTEGVRPPDEPDPLASPF
jgi:serine/threonine-protein kinase